MANAVTRSGVTFAAISYSSYGMPAQVATIAKYSPQRFSSHSAMLSRNSTTA